MRRFPPRPTPTAQGPHLHRVNPADVHVAVGDHEGPQLPQAVSPRKEAEEQEEEDEDDERGSHGCSPGSRRTSASRRPGAASRGGAAALPQQQQQRRRAGAGRGAAWLNTNKQTKLQQFSVKGEDLG